MTMTDLGGTVDDEEVFKMSLRTLISCVLLGPREQTGGGSLELLRCLLLGTMIGMISGRSTAERHIGSRGKPIISISGEKL